jgi:hypothetical protein
VNRSSSIPSFHPRAKTTGDDEPKQARRPLVLAGIWLLLVAGSMSCLGAYSNTPGTTAAALRQWPAESRLARDSDRPTLVLVAHPHCPCTNATLGELELLMAQARGKVAAHVVFIRPAGLADEWAETDLWCKAAAIPGVRVEIDKDGVEARRFHAETSGATLLYSEKGRLLFEGGITLSRGHAGDNPGRSAITAILRRESPDETKTPVFGCPLFAAACDGKEMACKR